MSEVVVAPARSRSAWKWVTLADVGKVITGNTPPTADAENYGDAIPFVKPTELVDRGIRSAPSGLAPQAMGKARVVPVGAVLVSCIGNLGKTGIAKVPVAFNQQINAVVFNESVVPEFGFYYAQTLKPWLCGESSATTIPIVNKGKFQQARFPLAPLDEQREIVAELEKHFSRLDEAVANLQRVKANLKRYKASVLKAAVEGRLVETEATLARREGRTFETGEQLLQRIIDERQANWSGRGKWKAPEAPTTDAPLPGGWTWASVDQLADVGTGATPKRDKAAYWNDGDVPWVTSSVVNGDYVDEASEFVTKLALAETNLTLYPIGTLLIAMYGEGKTRGKCTELRIPAATNQALAALQVHAFICGYLRHFLELNYEEMRKVASGGVQPNLNLSLVRAVCVPLPPLAEQVRIVAEGDRHLSIVREVEAEVDTNLQRAQALRHATLSKAFSRS